MSSSFGSFERYFSNLLSSSPMLKAIGKSIYVRLAYLFHKKRFKHRVGNEIHHIGGSSRSSFFGYYDKCPESSSGLVLCHLTESNTKDSPNPNLPVYVALFCPQEKRPILKVETFAYNWQQGARVHWLNEELFIFNTFDPPSSSYRSKVYSARSMKEIKTFELPVQESFGTDYFLSINYQRLHTLSPDYGYRNLPPLNRSALERLDDDGIWLVDYQSERSELLFSLEDICSVNRQKIFADAYHTVNHLMVSPDGEKCIFIHRYYLDRRRIDRLVMADLKTKTLRLLLDSGMVSHCSWIDNNRIAIYAADQRKVNGYYILEVDTAETKTLLVESLGSYGDGHPHVKGNIMVTDSYPDRARMQHLFRCDLYSGNVEEVGEFFHGFDFSGESRCDLHPRLSPDASKVYFDSVYDGRRALYYMAIS